MRNLILRITVVCASVAAAVSSFAGNYVVTTEWVYTGTTEYISPGYVNGSWGEQVTVMPRMEPEVEQNAINDSAPATIRTGINMNWTFKVNVDWVGTGTKPADIYLSVGTTADVHYDGMLAQPDATVENGMQDDVVHSTSTNYESWIASGNHLIRLAGGQTHYELSYPMRATIYGKRIIGADPTTLNANLTGNAALSDRAVAITSNYPTYSRGAGGATVLNGPDAAGNMYGDLAVTVNDVTTPIDADSYTYDYSFVAYRYLGGGWHTSNADLFNEWWVTDRSTVYTSDGGLSENTSVNPSDGWGWGRTRSVTPLLTGPATVKVRYKATDSVDSISGQANYFMRMHLPHEKVSVLDTKTGQLDRCGWPQIEAKHPKILLASIYNNTPGVLHVPNVTISYAGSTTYGVSSSTSGTGTIDLKVLKIEFGFDDTKTTTNQWTISSSITVSYDLAVGQTLEVYAVPLGTATKNLTSCWGSSGFTGDATVYDSRSGAGTNFQLEFVVH